ncbi:MAG TPA: septum formation initiator family protein [Candidatus Gracilibacteria bacterium]|nr:septum formation initiator family protein [Candidatus Gracilibacteria bacterium]
MAFRFQHTSHTAKLIIIAEFLFVSYLLYSLTKSVYQNYQFDVHVQNYKRENQLIEEENRLKSEEFAYYSSDAYVEKIAKQNLGLVNRGEEVIIIPDDDLTMDGMIGIGDEEEPESPYQSLNNPQKWWKFFFDIKE